MLCAALFACGAAEPEPERTEEPVPEDVIAAVTPEPTPDGLLGGRYDAMP